MTGQDGGGWTKKLKGTDTVADERNQQGDPKMKKLPEFLALSIGMGVLSLAGAIAWQTVEHDTLQAPVVEMAPTSPEEGRPMQAGVISTGR